MVKQLNMVVNGINVEQFAIGDVHHVSASVGTFMIAAGWVREEMRSAPRRGVPVKARRSTEDRRVLPERRVPNRQSSSMAVECRIDSEV
jgi:hypothetical protein